MANSEDELMKKAEKLAARSYAIEVYEETLKDGKEIYLVKNPELRGCMAQGETREEAINELNEARITYIHSLLLDNLEVPEPAQEYTITGTSELKVNFKLEYKEEEKPNVVWGRLASFSK
ncbi:MAG: type II toxin-antitoxin system HicB family antitoxin [Anaerolineaceae bacterium]|nr:type II toxin-antitoxin system HicB family antitoxin [Anaerolineaceae bacterium]